MPLTTIMSEIIPDALLGGTDFPRFDSTNSYLGVGNGDTPFDPGQTDLRGALTVRKPAVDGTPVRTGNTVTVLARFGPDEANFRWEEWGWFNAESGGQMANRAVTYIGEKTQAANATWELEVEITFGVA